MKHATLVLALLSAGFLASCANPSRSRDLNNPSVPAVVLAQQVCSNCHGIAGVTVSPNFPNLAAQTPAYFVAQLKQFKSHNRQDPAGFEYMWGLSRSLTDEQIDGLAAYFANQAPPPASPEGDERVRAAGKAIFLEGMSGKNVPPCMACHGNAGQGNETFPRLAGQHADYIVKQLIVFQRTEERPEGAIMKTVAHELSEDDIRNVAAYVQSLP
jgi:cytochrome c553